MASFISNIGKKSLLDLFKADLESGTSNYYIGISSADSSSDTIYRQERARNEMNFMKVISNHSYVVPKYTWSSGQIYNAYDNDKPDQTLYYVINSNDEVFVCIEQSKDNTGAARNSTVEPTEALATAYKSRNNSFRTSDGYVWRYLFPHSGVTLERFETASLMPVQRIATSSNIAEEATQFSVQNQKLAGEILSIAIDSGGTGYTVAPTLTIEGLQDSTATAASFTAFVNNGKITKITVDSDGFGLLQHGKGYNTAKVAFTGINSSAVLRPVIAPKGGIAADPVATLRATQLMIQTTIQDDESGLIPVSTDAGDPNSFKQVMLIKDPKRYDSDRLFTNLAGNAMDFFNVGAGGDFTVDEIFQGQSGNAKGKTYWHDTSNNKLYYVQNDSTGFGAFSEGETIASVVDTGKQRTINGTGGLGDPIVDRYSGDLLYINNLDNAVSRSSTQTEDIKIILDLGTD